jgi:hypothetical protein
MTLERRNNGAREMAVTRLQRSKHHVSVATVTRVIMRIPLGMVFFVRFAPTVMSSNCRVTARRCRFRAFRPKDTSEELVVGFSASRLQNRVLRAIGKLDRRTPVRDLHLAFKIPYV